MLKTFLICLLLSMAPVSELRGAIPYGLANDIPVLLLYPMCVLANLIPVPFVMLFLRHILRFMQRCGGVLKKAADWLESRGRKKSQMVKKYEMFGLFLLVAIPLPGTGAWTGALVAALLGRRIRNSMLVITAGVAVAGLVTLLVSMGVIHLTGL